MVDIPFHRIQRSAQKYRVALEVLSYHNTSSEEEVRKCLSGGLPNTVTDIDQYCFNPFAFDDFQKAKFTIYMFTDLFGLQRFDQHSLARFTLTIKKNYRRVPYHNWTHGFSVANTMYTVIKSSQDAFRPIEVIRIKQTNLQTYEINLIYFFMHHYSDWLYSLVHCAMIWIIGAKIISSCWIQNRRWLLSTAHRQWNITISIKQSQYFNRFDTSSRCFCSHSIQSLHFLRLQEGHNIFAKLNNNEYKQVLGLIKHCILATDLALFFPNKAKLSMLMEEEKFSWSILEHRMLMQAISMTASDLSASTKPWDIQVQTVKVIFEEFYLQGDAERAAGRQPISMMDRTQPDQQALSQVRIYNIYICLNWFVLNSHILRLAFSPAFVFRATHCSTV